MTLISENWTYALDTGIAYWFEQGFARRQSLIPLLFNVQNSSSSDEEAVGLGAVGTDAWDNYENAGIVSHADFEQGYKKTYTHKEYPMILRIKRKLYEDSKYPQIFRMALRLGDSARVRQEKHAASVINNAFSDTYAGADAVGLCSLVHPANPNNAGSTQANEGTLALTAANVATVREAMMAFEDDKGNVAAVTPDLLLVPPELEDEALIIAGSKFDPGTGNNAINPQSDRFRVLTWHYLTDSNAWFMIDSNLMKMSLDWWNRVPLQITPYVQDNTIDLAWIAYMRYSFGWSDWRWIYGNNPS
jgi:hypothetical protein